MSEFSVSTASNVAHTGAYSAEGGCRPAEAFSALGIAAPVTGPIAAPPRARNGGAEHRFPLVFCPEMPCGTFYSLIRRGADGSEVTLYDGLLDSETPSLNLAEVRHRGARLGATEVLLVPPHAGVRLVSLEP